MASQFADAIMGNVLASMSPDAEATRKAIASFVEDQQVQVALKKSEAIAQVEQLLTAAIGRDANTAVISAYQKILAKLSS